MDESEVRMFVYIYEALHSASLYEDVSQRAARAYPALQRARWRAWCFGSVIELDLAKKNGHTAEHDDISKRQPHVWSEGEYQEALARIRDFGIMKGVPAYELDKSISSAHVDAASGIYK